MKNKWIIYTISFLIVFVLCFLIVNDAVTPTGDNRKDIVGFYHEKKNSLDVVFIGASSTDYYVAPMELYKNYGITSYDLSAGAMAPSLTKGFIEETLKYQNPKLFVVDLRTIDTRDEDPYKFSNQVRNYTDFMRLSKNRIDMINYCYEKENSGTPQISDYIPYFQYHSRVLVNYPDWIKWELNGRRNDTKGFLISMASDPQEEYIWPSVAEKKKLNEDTEGILVDLLDYCKENEIPVIFTLNVMAYHTDDMIARYNYVNELLDSYGYAFLNTNYCNDEIGIDFETDFMDANHVNLWGALKYTDYIGQYIKTNYDIPDHRGEEEYADWDELLDKWNEEIGK